MHCSTLWQNIDNDSADVTLAARLFQVHRRTTGGSLVGDSCLLDRQHLQMAIIAGRMKRSVVRQVSNVSHVIDWTEVLYDLTRETLVYMHGNW